MKYPSKLTRLYRRSFAKPLKLFWWRYEYPTKLNFGDELTPLLIERLFGYKCQWTSQSECEIAGAGSIIESLQRAVGDNAVAIWGSGFIQPGPANSHRNFTFHAVRGKLSLERIDNQSAALGDPGLLMPLVVPASSTKTHRLGLLPHYVDVDAPEVQAFKADPAVKIINALDPVEKVISDITSCELVISSSMHGLILSDAYNVPNYWMPFSDKLTGGDYKFRDYYSVFGREPAPIKPFKPTDKKINELIKAYKPLPNLADIQQKLINAFPYR